MSQSYLTPKLKEGQEVDLSKYNPRQRTNIRLYGLDNINWNSTNVYEYKMNWLPYGEIVKVSNWREATRWCKENLFMQDWHLVKYAEQDDTHHMLFKNAPDALLFKLSSVG